MKKVIKLTPDVTNKIAAGEVIERPSSVIKELVENSVDAGSRKIELHVFDGGKEKIQIIDDGCGMSRDDALLSLERFTTSKISSFDDLLQLDTFGFRGEALASIASVSIMEIRTKTNDDLSGVMIRSEGGNIAAEKSIPWNKGTSITVSNLFYNTPARRKFQKSTLSETRQIYKVFRTFALAYPDIYFILYKDNKVIWKLPSSDLKIRIEELFDNVKADKNLIEVNYSDNLYKLTGYIGVPEWTKSTRNDQFLFLNNRYIKNRTADHGIYQGYGTTLSHSGGHPFYVLMLEMPSDKYDINIHPTKLEARFHEERSMHHCFSQGVKRALGSPLFEFKRNTENIESESKSDNKLELDFSKFNIHIPTSESTNTMHRNDDHVQTTGTSPAEQNLKRPYPGNEMLERKFDTDKVWQVHQCFIFAQVKSGLIVIDQHTAHERILYEKALKMLQGENKVSQQLLFPQAVNFDRDLMIVLNEVNSHLENIGFFVKIFGDDTAIIEAVPIEVKMGREAYTLKKILEEYTDNQYKDIHVHERVAQSYACRSAIMKGDKLSTEEMYRLIDDLFATEFPFYCPHGRPTVIDIPLKELNSRFIR